MDIKKILINTLTVLIGLVTYINIGFLTYRWIRSEIFLYMIFYVLAIIIQIINVGLLIAFCEKKKTALIAIALVLIIITFFLPIIKLKHSPYYPNNDNDIFGTNEMISLNARYPIYQYINLYGITIMEVRNDMATIVLKYTTNM